MIFRGPFQPKPFMILSEIIQAVRKSKGFLFLVARETGNPAELLGAESSCKNLSG